MPVFVCAICSVVGYLPPAPVSTPRNSVRNLRRIRLGAILSCRSGSIWHARLAMKTLRRDQREAIGEAADIVIQALRDVTFTG